MLLSDGSTPTTRRAEPRQRFAKNAAAAADIEHPQAGEAVEPHRIAVEMRGSTVADVSEPHRIELVQRRHRPARVPPLPGDAGEARDFFPVDGASAGYSSVLVSVHLGSPLFLCRGAKRLNHIRGRRPT